MVSGNWAHQWEKANFDPLPPYRINTPQLLAKNLSQVMPLVQNLVQTIRGGFLSCIHTCCRGDTWIWVCGHTYDVVIYLKFHQNLFWGFGATRVEICQFPLLWLLAFATACATMQTVISSHVMQLVNVSREWQISCCVCIDKPATVVVLKPVADGLVPGVVTQQRAKVSQQLPQAPPTFASPAAAVSQTSQAAIIQKLLQGGAFVIGRLPNDGQPYLMPSSGVGLQPFQVVFGSAGAKLQAGAEPLAVPVPGTAGVVKSSADGMIEEAALAASHLLAEESREAAEKKILANNSAATALSTTCHSTVHIGGQPNMTSVDQVLHVLCHNTFHCCG